MSFKVRRIKQDQTKKTKSSKIYNYIKKNKKALFISLAILLSLGLSWGFWQKNDLKNPRIFGKNILKNDKNDHINILLLGVAGKTKEGGHLSDSIMIASVNPSIPSISMLSFPRDLFISSKVGKRKINEVYAAAQYKYGEKKGLDITKEAIGNFAGIEIHYGAVVDFDIFEDAIDLLGGVDVFVANEIVDPYYPDKNYGFQTFIVRKGLQHFDGATALKYARSRKTTSDYDRAKRQQDLALAIRTKVEANGWANNLSKLRELYDVFRRRVNTDMNLVEMGTLAKMGMGIDYGDIISSVLNDDPTQKGGLLYSPAREFYSGQFVLLPESEKDTKEFIKLTLIEPETILENAQISVLNGSGVEGKAGELAARLRQLGFHIAEIGNYETQNIEKSFVKKISDKEKTAKFLEKYIGLINFISPENDLTEGIIDFEIVIGSDF